jgi:hypothetical protein
MPRRHAWAPGAAPARSARQRGGGRNAATPTNLQELTNVIRTTADLARVLPFNAGKALAIRGTADQAALVEWLVLALDVTSGTEPLDYVYQDPNAPFVRVFYLQNAQTPGEIMELVNSIRVIAEINRVFLLNGLHADLIGNLAGSAVGSARVIEIVEGLAQRIERR